MSSDKIEWPLLPRSGTIDAIQDARAKLHSLEDTLGRELSFIAQELDRARRRIGDVERELSAKTMESASLRSERDDWKSKFLEATGEVEIRRSEQDGCDRCCRIRQAKTEIAQREVSK